jgi:putative membrane protein
MDNPIIAGLFLILFALPAYYYIVRTNGYTRGIFILCVLNLFALGIETFALKTGQPYGEFSYSDSLGYKIAGLTPWSVGLSWSMILIGATAIVHKYVKNKIFFIPAIVVLLLITDFVLDPGAVALKYWSYTQTNSLYFYNVPLSNFIGWILSGTIGSIFFHLLSSKKIPGKAAISLLFIALFWTGIDLYKGLYIPALIGVLLIVTCLFTVLGSESEKG